MWTSGQSPGLREPVPSSSSASGKRCIAAKRRSHGAHRIPEVRRISEGLWVAQKNPGEASPQADQPGPSTDANLWERRFAATGRLPATYLEDTASRRNAAPTDAGWRQTRLTREDLGRSRNPKLRCRNKLNDLSTNDVPIYHVVPLPENIIMANESIFDVAKCIGAFATDFICLTTVSASNQR